MASRPGGRTKKSVKPSRGTPKPKPRKAKPAIRPKSKPTAARRRKPKPKPAPRKPRPQVDFVTPARSGDLEALRVLTGPDDRLSYKWLQAAADAGYGVTDQLARLFETSSLRDDVDHYQVAAAHWELATAYLEGSEGLPVDLQLAQRHLEKAFERHDLASINARTRSRYSPATLLLKLTGEAWKTLEAALTGIPDRAG
jgi:hypothetical protein